MILRKRHLETRMLSLFNPPSHIFPPSFSTSLFCRIAVEVPNKHKNFLTADKEVRVTSESKLTSLILINTIPGAVTAYGS